MKKILSGALALMTCLTLTVPALTAGAKAYAYPPSPWYGGYAYTAIPWTGAPSYWSGNSYAAIPWSPNLSYTYVPSDSNPIYSWTSGFQSLGNFQAVRTYTSKTFQDVPDGAWYETGVKTLYEMGLLSESSKFYPESRITLAEVVSLAVQVHCVYNNWTLPGDMTPLQYALNVGIVERDQYDDYTDFATRRSFAAIMAKALPSEALRGINVIMDGDIPDVSTSDPGAPGIYLLYRAGVLTGIDARGAFYPNDYITRDSAAVITARMVDASQRKGVTLIPFEANGVSLDRSSMTLRPGQSQSLSAFVYPVNAANRAVHWASSDYSVVTVDDYGNVTALRLGTAIITATTVTGAMASCKVEVANLYYGY